MCKGKSVIVTKNEVYESNKSNSHENIKKEFNLKDTQIDGLLIAELHPKDGVYICSTKRDDWELVLENEPNWYKEDCHLYQDRIFNVLFDKVFPRWKEEGVSEGMDLSNLEYKQLPNFKKIKVGGGFYCSSNQLTTLAGAPAKVGGDFYCSSNQLTTLAGAPAKVGRGFYCHNNPDLKENYRKFIERSKKC